MESENKNQSLELKKHSALVSMKNEISLVQRKMYNSVLYLASKEVQKNPNQMIFSISFKDIISLAGLEDTTNATRLKADLKALQNTDIEFNITNKDGDHEWGIFSLLAQVNIVARRENITIGFPPVILQNIVRPNIYAMLNISIMNKLTSKISLALYELLVDYKRIENYTIDIKTYRNIIGIEDNEYNLFSDFKKRCLTNPVAEINEKTDLNIEFELLKTAGEYSAINFTIKSKATTAVAPVESTAYMLLINAGISKTSAMKFSKKYPLQTIENAINSLNKSKATTEIKNATAYLTTILNNSTITTVAPTKTTKAKTSTSTISEPAVDLELNAYLTKRKKVLFTSVSENTITEFINNQNNFTLEHLREKNIIDENNNVIDIKELKKTSIFKGYIENNYFNVELETKQFYSSKQ